MGKKNDINQLKVETAAAREYICKLKKMVADHEQVINETLEEIHEINNILEHNGAGYNTNLQTIHKIIHEQNKHIDELRHLLSKKADIQLRAHSIEPVDKPRYPKGRPTKAESERRRMNGNG